MGLLATFSLLVTSCRRRSKIPMNEKGDNPSINFHLVFLRVFALSMLIYLSVNIIIYIREAFYESEDFVHSVFLVFVNILYILFTVSQIVFLSYNKRSILNATIHLHFSIVCLLAANLSLWYTLCSSTVDTLPTKGNKTAGFQNRSCFHSSEI